MLYGGSTKPRIYHVPSANVIGAHVIRYTDGRVAMCSSSDQPTRATLWWMLEATEQDELRNAVGRDVMRAWVEAEIIRPCDVPEALRAAHFDYDNEVWPLPKPEYAAILNTYPASSTPPP